MEKEAEKIEKPRSIAQDVRRPDIKKSSIDGLEKKLSFRRKSFFKMLFLAAAMAIMAAGAGYLYLENKNMAERVEKENFSYCADNDTDQEGDSADVESADDAEFFENDQEVFKREDLGGILEEASSMKKSRSDDWWLNSGGVMYSKGEEFSTNIGPLPKDSSWRKLYAKSNPRDTDDGYFPQNIFRLVTREKWKNFSQSVYFKIEKINLSKSEYRNESNGILLFNRYHDGDNLYYTGVRVDGNAIIKKKIDGEYFTMAEKDIFENDDGYDPEDNPNLIPENEWIGIRSELENIEDDSVEIRLFVDFGDGEWKLVLETEDEDDEYGEAPFLKKGYAGIRTDFMDVRFKDYAIEAN